MDRNTMNETFKKHNLKWRTAERQFEWDVPKDLNPQDWLLLDEDDNIVALGDGPTRTHFEKKPTLREFNERIAAMGISQDDERYADLKASVLDIEINYPSPEEVFEKLQTGEEIERFAPKTADDETLEKMGRLMGEGKLK